MEINIENTETILRNIEDSINSKSPFSLIRFGDGGLKLIYNYLSNNEINIDKICKREGIPKERIEELLVSWSYFANQANYIDSPEVYFSDFFWKRYEVSNIKKEINPLTMNILKNWQKLYEKIGIRRCIWCNPEINFLSLIRFENREIKNLLDII